MLNLQGILEIDQNFSSTVRVFFTRKVLARKLHLKQKSGFLFKNMDLVFSPRLLPRIASSMADGRCFAPLIFATIAWNWGMANFARALV